MVKPDNQLELTEEELNEEIAKMFTANNPLAPKDVVRFNSNDRTYALEPMVDQLMVHYSYDGYLLHKASDEAKAQMAADQAEEDARKAYEASLAKPKDGEEVDESKQLRNQFNFTERASQTQNLALKDRACATDPPPINTQNASATQWEIYDAYMRDQENQRIQREIQKNRGKKVEKDKEEEEEEKPEKKPDTLHGPAMGKAVKVVERMVNQNSYDDIAQDFKYWDDASDTFREGEGTLLPLWKFYCDRAQRKHVTAICWNPEYTDLFAVGYGSFDFVRQCSGLICIYSLKNPSYPEYIYTAESGVMCLDFHPQHSSLLAVGCYDGSILVFDIRDKVNRPIYQTTNKSGKHTDPVWQVSWQEEDLSKSLQFYTVSSDGRVSLWTLMKNGELEQQEVMELKPVSNEVASDLDEEAALGTLSGGCSFDFNKTSDHLFVVGTEEGLIHKCSKAYSSQYLETYFGHHMPVYNVNWNYFHPRIFLSGCADWTVKVWDHSTPKAAMTFDLNNSVGDIAWAPFSSTVFAAATADGKVHVFDLDQNKQEPMCEQKVVLKAKLTKISFNPKHPIILVGDDRGCVTSLKLSPNLRKALTSPKEAKEQVDTLQKVIDNAFKGEGNL